MREARFIFPFNGDLGGISMHIETAIKHIIAAFGGLTETSGNGFWVDGLRRMFAEQVRILDVAYEPTKESDTKLYDIANAFRIDAKQTEVYLRYGNGHVQMVKEDSEMDNGEFDWAGMVNGLGHDIDPDPEEAAVA